MNSDTRILLVDDHELMRRGVRTLLESQPGYEVCGEAADGRAAVKLALQLQPEIVIMDIGMPGLNGLDAARQIREALPAVAILILSMHDNDRIVDDVLDVGAQGYILKSDAGRDLIEAIESLKAGEPYFASSIAAAIERQAGSDLHSSCPGRKRVLQLTPREREVVQLLAEGSNNQDVATQLSIGIKTVETHRERIMKKLDLESFAELVRYAIRNQIVTP